MYAQRLTTLTAVILVAALAVIAFASPVSALSHHSTRHVRELSTKLEAIRERMRERDESWMKRHKLDYPPHKTFKQREWFYYIHRPQGSCPFLESFGDKWLCYADRFATYSDCLIYSFGTRDLKATKDFEFELNKIAPNCEFHLFDPTLEDNTVSELVDALPSNFHFHSWGLGPPLSTKITAFKTLGETVDAVGHGGRRIHDLKVDIEGSEWTALLSGLKEVMARGTRVDELHVEVHMSRHMMPQSPSWEQVALKMFDGISDLGFIMFHSEANPHRPAEVFEISWIHQDAMEDAVNFS